VFQTTNDSEVMINLIARYAQLSLADATARVMGELEGGFAVVLMDRRRLIGLRDRNGVRPLVIGELDGGHVIASEPAALAMVGATFLRDVRPGELVVADDDGLHARQVLTPEPTPCAFEWIYFARGDGVLDGADVHAARVRMGEILAREAPAEADVVVGVPESGLAAALGYARASGIPFDLGLQKSPYAGRSFIAPNKRLRDQKVRLKLAPTGAVRDKRVVLVDDSIVRGTTSGRIVQLLREAGAREVHFRVSSPPIRFPATTASTPRRARSWRRRRWTSRRCGSTSAPTRSRSSPRRASRARSRSAAPAWPASTGATRRAPRRRPRQGGPRRAGRPVPHARVRPQRLEERCLLGHGNGQRTTRSGGLPSGGHGYRIPEPDEHGVPVGSPKKAVGREEDGDPVLVTAIAQDRKPRCGGATGMNRGPGDRQRGFPIGDHVPSDGQLPRPDLDDVTSRGWRAADATHTHDDRGDHRLQRPPS
jgi:adenine/guanine phosphoribosyltransferase-like PRPP-binding protein